MAGKTAIEVAHVGLGEILRTRKLAVPPNQREYSWTAKEVRTLLQDFASAIHEGGEDYFLGTIVVVRGDTNLHEIVDGQQRLATTAILLAAIRDYLKPFEPGIAGSIDSEYLSASSENMRDREPRIRLNLADSQFFTDMLLKGTALGRVSRGSHQLLHHAYEECLGQVRSVVRPFDQKQHGDVLVSWLKFIRDRAQVVLLTIGSDGNAYRMFETLNDRGLKTTQADLVKNYLFGRASKRLPEVQEKWASMRGALETLDDDLVPTVTYLRHAVMLHRGYFRENALHDTIQSEAKSPQQVAALLAMLENVSTVYASLFNPESEQWNGYPDTFREAIRTLNLLNIAGVRPLMLAVALKFSKRETTKAFAKFVSWKARYLVAGSTLTGGYIEVPLAAAAKRVHDGELADEKALSREMSAHLPNNEQFEEAFASATVSKTALARYYLRTLEQVVSKNREPAFVPNSDREAINLEHILPIKPLDNWPQFLEAEAKADAKRIGNMALLQVTTNSNLRSVGFAKKQEAFRASPFELTRQLGDTTEWNHESIVSRQAMLAKLAVKAWPL